MMKENKRKGKMQQEEEGGDKVDPLCLEQCGNEMQSILKEVVCHDCTSHREQGRPNADTSSQARGSPGTSSTACSRVVNRGPSNRCPPGAATPGAPMGTTASVPPSSCLLSDDCFDAFFLMCACSSSLNPHHFIVTATPCSPGESLTLPLTL